MPVPPFYFGIESGDSSAGGAIGPAGNSGSTTLPLGVSGIGKLAGSEAGAIGSRIGGKLTGTWLGGPLGVGSGKPAARPAIT